jgi:hypothetical protein
VFISVYDQFAESRLRSEYPGALFTPVPGLEKSAWRVEIPSADIENNKSGLFKLTRTEKSSWRRRYYAGHYGIGRALVCWEDLAEKADEPVTYQNFQGVNARASSVLEIPGDVSLDIKLTGNNPYAMKVDGRCVVRSKGESAKPLMARLKIPAGRHQVDIETIFEHSVSFPSIEGMTGLRPTLFYIPGGRRGR